MDVEGMAGSPTWRLGRGDEKGEGESGARGRRVWRARGVTPVERTGSGAPAKAATEGADGVIVGERDTEERGW